MKYKYIFIDNVGIDTQRAGAIYLEGSQTVKVYNSNFKNIKVISRGGCFQINGNSYMLVDHCYFDTIYASDAGAIFNSGYDSKVEIKNCYCKYKKFE